MNWTPFVLPIVISFGITVFIININNISNICESNICPLCYGEDLCKDINDKISLSYETISYLFYNLLSVKNVYFAKYGNDNVVLKKLAHNDELTRLDLIHCMTDTVLTSYNQSYKLCDDHTVKLLLEQFEHVNFTNLCTILNVNIEPIVLQLFKDDFPVPKFYGSCGRVIVVGNSGTDLNSMESLDWFDRAYLSYQLLEAAQRFTYDHPSFRLYLMDISPDNIVVNKDLVVNFVDLEHVILKAKGERVGGLHRSEDFPGEPYGFSEGEICGSEVSDHNVYSVCKLLLSKSSPWPMMNGGLLHDPPPEVLERHRRLFDLVELCVVPYGSSNRFELKSSSMMEGSQTSYSRFNCAQKQCTTKVGHNISLFSFPKDPECAKLWALYCDRPEMLSLTPEELNRNFKLCEKHFSAEDVESGGLRKRIQRGALPIKPHDGKRRSSRQKGKEMAAEGKGGKEMAARGKGGKEKAAGDERDPLDINSTDFASLFGNNVEFVIEEESDTITISKATESDKQGAAEVTLNPIKSNPTKSSSSSSKPKDFNSSFMSFVDKKVNKEKNQPGLTPQYNKITEPVAVKSPATPMRKLNDNPAPKRKLDEDQASKVNPMLAIPPPRQEQQVMVPAPAQLFLVNPGPIPLAIQLDPSGVGYLSAFPMQAMPPLIVPTVPVALNNPQQVQVPVVPKKDAVKRSEPRALDKVNILRKKPRVEPPPPPEKPKNSSMILTSPISTKYTNIQKLLADTKLHLSKATNRCASAEKAEYIMVVDNEADNNKEKVEKPEKVTVINDKRISVIESSEKTPSESLNSSGGTQEAEEPKKKIAVPAKVNGGVNSAPSQVNSGSGLCYVPNCSLKKGEKVFLFKVPYDQQLIDIWQKCIGRKDRPLEKSDTVCEKHFSKDDIQVLVQHHDRNLMAFPRLKKLAIPCVEYFKGCCVPRCGKTNGRMYKFPVTTPHAVQLWLYMLKASDLLKLPIEELVRYRVCERHFERTSFDEKGELLHSAAPMQHVPVTDTKFLEQDVVEISKDDSKKSSLKCIFRECRLNKPQDPDLQIFLFPSDFDRCKQWLRICKRIDLLRSTSGRTLMNLSRFGFGMCSRHFVESDFVEGDKSQLRMEAVPKPDPANDVVVVLDSHSSPDPTLNCAVFFCEENSKPSPGSSRPGQQQFPFPDPINDKERYHIWLKLVGNPELVGMPPEFVRSKYGVCRKHFESHFYNRTAGQEQLVSVAVPTKNLIGPRKWLFGTKFYQTKIKEYINKCINADSSSKGNIKWMLSEFLDANQPQSVCTLNENQIKFPALGHHLEFKDVKKEKAPFEVFNCTKKNFTLVKDIGRGEMVNIHSAVIIADDNRVQKEVMQNLIDELVKADENKKVTNFKVNIPV